MSFDLVKATAYLTCGALMLFLGFVVLRENPRQRVNRITAGMLLFGGLGPILGAYGKLVEGGAVGAVGATDVFRQFAFLWEFFFPSTLLFALVFPTMHPWLVRWPRLSLVLFVPHVSHVVLVMLMSGTTSLFDRFDPAAHVPFGASVVDRAFGLLRIALELLLRIHVRFFSFVNLSMAVASWALLMRSSRRSLNPKLRSQVRTIRLGVGISLALYSGGVLVPTVFGLTPGRDFTLPLVTVSLLVGASSIVVAIIRLGFLDVRFIVRRGLAYGLASGVIVALYLFVGKQIDRLSGQLVGQQLPVFETTFLVLSLFLLQPILAGIERFVDRQYSRDRSDVRNALTRLSGEVSLLLEPERVCERVATTIRREMVLETAAVVSRDRRSGSYSLTVARAGVERFSEWGGGPLLFEALAGRREPVAMRDLMERPREARDRERFASELDPIAADLAIPLWAATPESGAEGELVGVVMLGPKVTETRITFEETALVSFVAHQLGTSLMNGALHQEQVEARLLEEEIATARKIQQQLLPSEPPELEGWELCASNRPSRHVGGDYHDFLVLPKGELGIAIGDVSGKGVPAALLMSNLQAALRIRVLDGQPPDRVVRDVNRQIYSNTGSETFISFFLGELHPREGTFSFTNAGHNAPVLVRQCGDVETLEDGGLLLGVFPEATYECGRVGLEPGDFVAFYTDGVTEASNPVEDLFSEERLVDALVRNRTKSAVEVHGNILEEIRTFQEGRPPDDDLTLIVLKRVDGVAT